MFYRAHVISDFVQNNIIIKCYLCKWLGERQHHISDKI